jgi:hypothetical protein
MAGTINHDTCKFAATFDPLEHEAFRQSSFSAQMNQAVCNAPASTTSWRSKLVLGTVDHFRTQYFQSAVDTDATVILALHRPTWGPWYAQ